MTKEEFFDKITHIVDDARTPDQSEEWSDEYFDEIMEYARIKCLEAIKNTRHKACEIVNEYYDYNTTSFIEGEIQNIKNEDVLPEL